MRPDEELARKIIELALGVPVVPHDDNREERMYDFRVGAADSPSRAIEVTGAVDPRWRKTWKAGPAQGPYQFEIQGDWWVQIEPGTHRKTLQKQLPSRLGHLEELGLTGSYRLDQMWELPKAIYELQSLGVLAAHCIQAHGAGQVWLTMPPAGGAVDESGSEVADWTVRFLRHPDRDDVLDKLQRAKSAARREVFIWATLPGAPWSVMSYLTWDLQQLPNACPILPAIVDAVWLASFNGPAGVRWDSGTWSRFQLAGL